MGDKLMGFSLVGNSGDQTTTSNVFETNYSASLNPQLNLDGGAGGSAQSNSPLFQGSPLSGSYSNQQESFYNPINIVTTGDNLGDAALAALNQVSSNQTASTENPAGTSSSPTLASLFSGSTIYYILAAIVIFFIAEK